jgi:hypothetical protein
MDYLKSLDPPTVIIKIAGQSLTVPRVCLKNYFLLKEISKQYESSDATERVAAVFDYLKVATGIEDIAEIIHLDEIAVTFDLLVNLNDRSINVLPWQTVHSIHEGKTYENLEYEGRGLAIIVSHIAEAYGWSEEKILELQPEAAFCYMQEIMIAEVNRQEHDYYLSEVAYDGKTGKPKTHKKPDWYYSSTQKFVREKVWVPAKYLPDGVIIDFEKMTNEETAEYFRQNH